VPLSLADRLALRVLRELPLHTVSRGAGWVATRPLPEWLRRPAIRGFAALVGADLSEARDPVESFATLQEFFTRALAPGIRPIDAAEDALVAPCDGAWGAAGRIDAGTLLQLKGRPYSLAALLGSKQDAERYEGGYYATFYLAPRDYHRFHTPCAARVLRAVYLPGMLWPVNRLGVEGVPGVFAENERICAHFAPDGHSGESLCIAAVGATMVGKVRVTFDDLTTGSGPDRVERRYDANAPQLAKGEEWGRFEFGSTLVLVTAPGAFELEIEAAGTPLRLGTRIGRRSQDSGLPGNRREPGVG
jgi:phosphatidylserine decarboxylase